MRGRTIYLVVLAMLLSIVAAQAQDDCGFVNPAPFDPQRCLFWDFDRVDWKVPQTIVGPVWDSEGWEIDDVFLQCGSIDDEQFFADLVFRIGNFNRELPVKEFWAEIVFQADSPESLTHFLRAPEGFESFSSVVSTQSLGDNRWLMNISGNVFPNPTYEDFVLRFMIPPRECLILEDMKVATACVPEPTSILLGAMGFVGVLGQMRRRNK